MGSSHNKGKRLEKKVGKWLLQFDAPCPKWGNLTTETLRTGHLSDLQMDVMSKTYAVECKNGGHVPKTPFKWLDQIKDIADTHEKEALVVMKVDGRKFKNNIMHGITPERHAELLEKEKKLEEV